MEKQNEQNIDKNNNESISDSQKPFIPIENINMIQELKDEEKNEMKSDDKIDLLLKNIDKSQSNVDSISLSGEESSSVKSNNNNINSTIKKKKKVLYEQSKKEIEPYQIELLRTINNIEEIVRKGEKERNYKMKSEFEREKEYKLEEQIDIKKQIEEISKNNINEKLINHLNTKINEQEDLNSKYDEMKEDINTKIQLIKNSLPSLEEKVKEKNEIIKKLNKENIKLMDKIKEIENENNNINNTTYMNNSQYGNNSSVILNNSQTNNLSLNILNNSDKIPGGIKINEIVKENEDIKKQYLRIRELKKLYKNKRIINQNLIKSINEMNTNCFLFKKIFNEGMHEIGKELLKIHELKLDKIIAGTNAKNSNSVYFQIVKDNVNGNDKKNDDILKLPLISKNIKEKYNYPIVEKSHPNTLIYNVVKNMLDENHNSSKISNIRKNKINWEEFKDFSAYQIYTILNMNKDVIKKIEGNIFPRKLIFSNIPPQEEEELNFLKNENELNELNDSNDFNDDF